ncbi:unnamed protein product [Sphenostylis stenocarpa]|uniref:Uncharacterized protein n=1 Tax=Sphenostylis stenocarpa TaxID=92480 RepID=A0AA86SZS1_9FABA|nr:unnamed protein product [Sphenostylis stenocarpa]
MGCRSFSFILTLLILTFASMIIDSRVAEARILPKSAIPLPSKVALPNLPVPVPLPQVPNLPVPLPEVPLVPLPNVPLPEVPLPNLPVPAVPLPNLPIPKLTVDGVKVLP